MVLSRWFSRTALIKHIIIVEMNCWCTHLNCANLFLVTTANYRSKLRVNFTEWWTWFTRVVQFHLQQISPQSQTPLFSKPTIFSRFNFNLFSLIQTITRIRKCSRILIASLETEGTALLGVISILMGFQSKTPSDLLKQFHDDDKQHKKQNKTSDTTTDNDLDVEQ